MSIKKLHLVGGAPLTGKSTFVKQQGYSNCLSTDWVETWMKTVARREDYPNIFYTEGHTAESFHAQYASPLDTVNAGVLAGKDMVRFIMPLLTNKDCLWDELTIEGVFVTPEFARYAEKALPQTAVTATFLHIADETVLANRLEKRGLWSRSEKYPQWVSDKELAYVCAYNTWFLNQTETCGFQVTTL